MCILNSTRNFLINPSVKINVILRREYRQTFGYFLKFMRLTSSISLISQNGWPRFASVIKRLTPYSKISFHCVRAKKQSSGENLRRLVGRSNVFRYKTTRKFMLYTCAFIASSLQVHLRLRRFKRVVCAIAFAAVCFKTIVDVPTLRPTIS